MNKISAQHGETLLREYRGGRITILGTSTSGEGEKCEARLVYYITIYDHVRTYIRPNNVIYGYI